MLRSEEAALGPLVELAHGESPLAVVLYGLDFAALRDVAQLVCAHVYARGGLLKLQQLAAHRLALLVVRTSVVTTSVSALCVPDTACSRSIMKR